MTAVRRGEIDRETAGAPPLERARLRLMSRAELDSAEVFRGFADVEADPAMRHHFAREAEREGEHARRWAIRSYEANGRMPSRSPSWLARFFIAAAHQYGTRAIEPLVRLLRGWHHRLGRRT